MIFKHLQDNEPVLKISDIADTSSGGTPNRGMIEYYNGAIPWVKSGELKDGIITTCEEYITDAGLKNSSAKLFPKGTLLVAMYGANIGKTGVLDFDATTNQAVCAIFPKVDISKDFLFWYFKQQRIEFIAIGKGGAQPNISQTIINNASIVVPDPKIQKKIVDFLEAIEQGKGIDNNFFIPEVLDDVERIYKYKNSYIDLSYSFENQLNQIENLNQAILQEAVKGKLVMQDKNDEPASELIKRIKVEKAKTGKKQKTLPHIIAEEIPFDIPENWVWCNFGELADLINGDRGKNYPNREEYVKIGIPWINTGHIEPDGTLSKNDMYFISEEKYNSLRGGKIQKDDLVYCLRGATFGKVAFVTPYSKGAIASSLMIIRLIDLVDKRYIYYYFKSKLAYNQLRRFNNGSAQPNLAANDVRFYYLPLPPLSEQNRIVAEIEKQLAKTKQLKEHIIANQRATEQLLKALLHQAFEVEEIEEV
jgi:type I restriction enzyme S subunit